MKAYDSDKLTVFRLYKALDEAIQCAHSLDWEKGEARALNDIHLTVWRTLVEKRWLEEYSEWRKR